MTSSSEEPAASRIARRFSNVRFVSDRTSPSSSVPVSGLMHPCPATKMKSPSMTACEYGPTGFGAFSVTMAFLKGSSSLRLLMWMPNALVQLQARYYHCDEVASEKCLSAATFVRPSVRRPVLLTPWTLTESDSLDNLLSQRCRTRSPSRGRIIRMEKAIPSVQLSHRIPG